MVLGVECDAGFRFNVGGVGWLEVKQRGGGVCDACTAAAATPTSLCLFLASQY